MQTQWIMIVHCWSHVHLFRWSYLYLQSSSATATVAWRGLPAVTSLGSEDKSMVNLKISFPSKMLSSFTGTSNEAIVTPAGNITVYGPDV